MKYIQQRYSQGKDWVSSFMCTRHRCVSLSLPEAHADLLKWQKSEPSDNKLLSSVCLLVFEFAQLLNAAGLSHFD